MIKNCIRLVITALIFSACANKSTLPLPPSPTELTEIKTALLHALAASSVPGAQRVYRELNASGMNTQVTGDKESLQDNPYLGNWYIMPDLKTLRSVVFDETFGGRMIYEAAFQKVAGRWEVIDGITFKTISPEQ